MPESTVSGGVVSVYVSLVFVPDISDPDRIILYLNNGGKENIARVLSGVVEEALRQAASTMTWEELSFAKAKMSADLIFRVTGRTLPDDIAEADVVAFLSQALLNGVADVHDLGVRIRRLNVTEVEAQGLIKENAQKAAAELLQREGESIEIDTLVGNTAKLKEKFPGISDELALEIIRTLEGHAPETIVRVHSSGNPFLDAMAAFNRDRGGRGGSDRQPGST